MAIGTLGRKTGSLLQRLAAGEVRAAITFAGQGADVLPGLTAVLDRRPELEDRLDAAAAVLASLAASPAGLASGRFRHGFDVRAWVDDPDSAPPPAYLRSCAVAYPLVLLAQLLAWNDLCALGPAGEPPPVVAVAGHSSGVLAALAVASAAGPVDDDHLARWLPIAFHTGLDLASAATAVPLDPTAPGPMAAISGVRPAQLAPFLPAGGGGSGGRSGGGVVVGLVNAPDRLVVSGPPEALGVLRGRLDAQAAADERDRAAGRPPEAPLRHRWETLPLDVPYHWPGLRAALDRHMSWLTEADGLPHVDDLAMPVLSPVDGTDLRERTGPGELGRAVAAGQFVEPVRWDRTVAALVAAGADWVLDLGPGVEVARLTGRNLRGLGPRVLPLASPEGLRILATPGASPTGPDLRYADLAPRLVELPDGRRHLDNRYTRATGHPPVVLPGMTPTTADAPIVAAAANAGFSAELAGGGQPAPWIFRERVAELGELLDPGVGVVLNSLYLDRPLWAQQVGAAGSGDGEGLLFAAKRAGAPFVGLTVSAGIPEADEAVALLDRLRAAGMVRNAFKPGTVEQIRQVLAIADAAPRHTVVVHIEGGRAGGHHSYEDLDELLLATYADLRVRPNVLLAVGGGVGTPARAAELLTGRWSLRHGEPVMPVDAVLVGTAAMACAEAAASPQVKAALVDLGGSPGWVARGGTAGGVHSGRSSLNADIHVADNAAARAAALLASVAGDAAAVAARHDEIVDALAATAKPWFGNLRTMTYGAALERFTALCAVGRGRRYDDGPWLDPTHRSRAQAIYILFATRLSSPSPVELRELDAPGEALAAFRRAFPAADTTLVHPADALAFVEVCDRPGKPVPFVPVIDDHVLRWYMADALWQAQDDRYPADAVFAIPGPAAVAGITEADEPVADLLARFEQAVVDELEAAGSRAEPRDRLVDGGLAPAPFATLARGRTGSLATLCTTPLVVTDDGRSLPNPLWTLVAPTDDISTDHGLARPSVSPDGVAADDVPTDDELVRFEAHPVDSPAGVVPDDASADDGLVRSEAGPSDSSDGVVAEATGPDEVTVTVRMAGDELVLRYERRAGAFHELDGSSARAAFHRATLAAGSAPGEWSCPAELAGAYRAATGARHAGVPVDVAFTLAWPTLTALLTDADMPALAGLPAQLGALVHHHHRVSPGASWPPLPGETGAASARITEVRNTETERHIDLTVDMSSPRGPLATVDAGLLVRHPAPAGTPRRATATRHDLDLFLDAAALDLLLTHASVTAVPDTPVTPGDRLHVAVEAITTWPADDSPPHHSAHGRIHGADGGCVGEVGLDRVGPEAVNPVDALVEVLGVAGVTRRERPRVEVARGEDVAPGDMAAFAAVGGDRNPLHRSVLAARAAGLEAPIVHGMWTAARAAAFVVDEVAEGESGRLVDWSVRFTAPVPLGAELHLSATRVAVDEGRRRIEVVVRAGEGASEGEGDVVAMATALVVPPTTALVFPGQGTQRPGLGADDRARSRAAREVWQRADAHTRARQGWSLLDVVDRNPTELRLADGSTVRHPDGVLHRTELTQVALVAHAAAQIAELQAAGVLAGGPSVVAAGHSVGEYGALVALGVLPLEVALDLVHERGRAMQAAVPRDDAGRSPYRLAAVDPSRAGLDAVGLGALVADVASGTGELAEIVNHNAAGRQYVVAGTAFALGELAGRLGSSAVRLLDGIDVPFHSTALAPAVDALRPHLERRIGKVDHRRLVDRWVPNLIGRPFRLDAGFVAEVAALTGSTIAGPAAEDPEDTEDPDDLARRLLIELLAHQVAGPVRWIEVQDALLAPPVAGGLGARRQVEVGPAHATVLADLARLAPRPPTIELLHLHHDRDEALELSSISRTPPGDRRQFVQSPDDTMPPGGGSPGSAGSHALAPAAPAGPLPTPSGERGSPGPTGSSPTSLGAPTASPAGGAGWSESMAGDRSSGPAGSRKGAPAPGQADRGSAAGGRTASSSGAGGSAAAAGDGGGVAGSGGEGVPTAGEALAWVLATQARVRVEQLRDDETLDELFQGASSRRNQVLIDLGREFDLSGTDGVLDLPLSGLADEITRRATRYRFPGVYLQATIAAGLTRSRLALRDARAHLATNWGLGAGLTEHVLVTAVMGTRPGASARGGPLGPWSDDLPATADEGRRLLDRAVEAVARQRGLDLRPPGTAAAGTVDEAAVRRAGERLESALVGAARRLVTGLGHPWPAGGDRLDAAPGSGGGDHDGSDHDRLAILDRELGADRAAEVAGRFDPRRDVCFAGACEIARGDLVALYHDALARRRAPHDLCGEAERLAIHGDDPRIAATVDWYRTRAAARGRPDVADLLASVTPARRTPRRPAAAHQLLDTLDPGPQAEALRRALDQPPDRTGTVALVTGAAPGSIAAELVRQLLRGGATVVATTSTPTLERRRWWREQYRVAAAPGAVLHVVPANLASFADVDGLVDWLADPVTPHPHRPDLANPPLVPDLIAPFAATSTTGEASDLGAGSETALRIQLVGVERLVARVAELRGRRHLPGRMTVLLPLSPNHGDLGGDGPYAETKAALEVLARRARSEPGWGRHARIVGARIGWVRGTGLMGANDALAGPAEQHLGIRTFSADEMGWLLAAACPAADIPPPVTLDPPAAHTAADPLRRHDVGPSAEPDAGDPPRRPGDGVVAADDPYVDLDLTGGLAKVPDLRAALMPLAADLAQQAALARRRRALTEALDRKLWPDGVPEPPRAPPAPTSRAAPAPAPEPTRPDPEIPAHEMVVIVGTGELGPCGTAATRFAMELDGPLPDAVVVELAWLCGLVRFEREGYRGRWVDVATGTAIATPGARAEREVAERYRAEVATRVGLRPLVDDGVVDPAGQEVLTTVHLDTDVTFEVASEQEARSFLAADPVHTQAHDDQGTWTVTRKAGAPTRVPRRIPHTRRVAGQLPTGLDLGRFGVDGDLLATADRMALVNLACTAEAFRQAGVEPEELLAAVHPAQVANTQGAGMGGMASVRHLLQDQLLDRERQPDRLQESLGNVVAAHVVQGYVGSYGPMLHPVAACATAGVSLEAAHDLIRSGRAMAVIAGGYDDLTPEGMAGFGDMQATAASDELEALGLEPVESSRANDVRRRGFVESQGGGAFLVVRGDVARDLGLPVQGVLVFAGSSGDGIHMSIPAPGMGVLAAAAGGTGSPLATALRRHGLTADDIAVVSKHDTSTELNDPNEADLHQRLQDALGRTAGNPLLVVSQKTVTGHAKGGAAAWQVAGMLQTMATGRVPGNRNLDRLDPAVAGHDHLVHGHRALRCAADDGEPVRAGLVTSLGFGHVSALLALAHPDTFVAALPGDERDDYLRRATARRAEGERRRQEVRHGMAPPIRRTARPTREAEARSLLDPAPRPGMP